MAPRLPPPPQPNEPDASNKARLLETVIDRLQQQNTTLMEQNATLMQQNQSAMQSLEASRANSETTQRQLMEILAATRHHSGASSSNAAPPTAEWSLESFLQHHPAKFSGKGLPDEADQWLRDIEKIFNAKRCPDENRLAYAEYLLTGEASHWWSSARAILTDAQQPITWEVFRNKFYEEYFPDSVRFAKEVEFLQLVQGNMSVSEYTNKFKHLVRFNTMATSEVWQCRKFENGLRSDLKVLISSLCIRTFPAMVERAKVLEKNMAEAEQQKKQQASRGPVMSRPNVNRNRTPYARPAQSSGSQSMVVTEEQVVDIMTKAVKLEQFEKLRQMLGVVDITTLTSSSPLQPNNPANPKPKPKRFVKNQIPDSILNDPLLNAAISVLPSNYNFEIHKSQVNWFARALHGVRARPPNQSCPRAILM
ncbi:uncharacterized protein LOC124819780 [Vigna umbellata]|uniref:uncharacterized protein LOC124819780 n=1 Tax=Vigna umbellata TaxID=87088 RepID=UPI001F5F5FB0|nr:uncharacterized protein LOC124819780 [Vigna umbellata]